MCRLVAATVLACGLTGCSTAKDPCAYLEAVRIGGADFEGDGYVPWSDGATPELITGPQGCEHVWVSFRTPNPLPADHASTRTALRVPATDRVVPPGISPVKVRVGRFDDGLYGYSGLRAFSCDSCSVHDTPHIAWFELTADDGCRVVRRVTIRPQWPYFDLKCGGL